MTERNPARQGGPMVAAQGVLPPAEDPGASGPYESPQNRLKRLYDLGRETYHDFMSDPTEENRAIHQAAYEQFIDAVLDLPFLREDQLLQRQSPAAEPHSPGDGED